MYICARRPRTSLRKREHWTGGRTALRDSSESVNRLNERFPFHTCRCEFEAAIARELVLCRCMRADTVYSFSFFFSAAFSFLPLWMRTDGRMDARISDIHATREQTRYTFTRPADFSLDHFYLQGARLSVWFTHTYACIYIYVYDTDMRKEKYSCTRTYTPMK